MTEQQRENGERGVVRTPRSAALDGRPYTRTIECEESAASRAKRAAVVARGRGARRGSDETEPPAHPD